MCLSLYQLMEKWRECLNLRARNSHFMQGPYGRQKIEWITCARVWSSLWCVGFTLNQKMMQIKGVWLSQHNMLDLKILYQAIIHEAFFFQSWLECFPSSNGKRMSKAHKVTITKRVSTGICKVFLLGNDKIYNPVTERGNLLVCPKAYIYMVTAWLWSHSLSSFEISSRNKCHLMLKYYKSNSIQCLFINMTGRKLAYLV